MHNTFANNLLQSITEFSALVFEADRAQKDSDRMNVRRALDYQESQGRNSADAPKREASLAESMGIMSVVSLTSST